MTLSSATTALLILFTLSNAKLEAVQHSNDSAKSFASVCGDIYTKKEFVLETQDWPGTYAANSDCSYLIKGPYCPTHFKFQFLDFNLETSPGCVKDRLEIDNLDALCGNKNGVKTYFSENGALQLRFISDGNISGRGYRILISRSSCSDKPNEDTTEEISTVRPQVPKKIPDDRTITRSFHGVKQCCQNKFNGKRFQITSPNFPYSLNTPADCTIQIEKTNANICRLRIHVLYFHMGAPMVPPNCANGFLQIDGKYICGCKQELKLISNFRHETIKEFRFRSSGLVSNTHSGFVIEIIQDECPKRYSPGAANVTKMSKEFRFYNDQANRLVWPNDTRKSFAEKLQLIKEKTEILDDDEIDNVTPKIVKHIYFFASPQYNNIPFSPFVPRDREETTYIDTSSINTVLTDVQDFRQCSLWNEMQLNELYGRFGRNLEQCRTDQDANENCVELNYVRGYFRSPCYPLYYPDNLNICYKFRKQSGYCSIRVHMKDFELQDSLHCNSDYLMFGNQYKYCGSRLYNTMFTLDLRQKDYEEVRFVTDAYYYGRGFSGVYEQIACQDMTYPIKPVNPPATEPPRPTTPSVVPCDMVIADKIFTIDVHDYNSQQCVFEIKKSSAGVCKVELFFEKFDLPCTVEALIIDDKMFCGHHSGRTVSFISPGESKLIIYRKTNANYPLHGLRVRIHGRQIKDDCPYPEVPAERLVSRKLNLTESEGTLSDFTHQNDTNYLISMTGKNFKDICGLITNTTEKKLPETFCDIFMNNENTTKCIPIKENSLYVPYGSKKLELRIKDVNEVEEIEFQEIDCDDLHE